MGGPHLHRPVQIFQVAGGEGGGVQLHPRQGQALPAVERAAPKDPAGQGSAPPARDLQQQGAVIQGDLLARPGAVHHGGGDREPSGPQKDLLPRGQGGGAGQVPHPELRPLQIQNQVGLRLSRPPGGGPELPEQGGGAPGQRDVGQIDPQAGHPRLKELFQCVAVPAGLAPGGVKIHGSLPL